MSTFFLNIVLLLFTLYFYKKIRNGMHIMQLGHYYNEPYVQWLKDNRKKHYKLSEFILLIIPIVGVSSCFLFSVGIIILNPLYVCGILYVPLN